MPQYTGPLTLGAGSRLIVDGAELPQGWVEDFDASKLGGRWIGSGVCIRQTWHDIGTGGDNWGNSVPILKNVFKLTVSTGKPWARFGILVTSAHIWANVGGTGSFDIGCGTSDVVVPNNLNVLNASFLAAGVEHRLWDESAYDSTNFERGRLVDVDSDPIFNLKFDGTSLSTDPTGSVSIAVFGVLVPDPTASDS